MTRIKLTNAFDEERARLGEMPRDRVRVVELDALVDTGATMLVLPADVVARLGLTESDRRRVRYADGRVEPVPLIRGVVMEILGRRMLGEALVEGVGTTALIGQIPLEALDLVVDPKSREVVVNPASPDAPLLDLLGCRVMTIREQIQEMVRRIVQRCDPEKVVLFGSHARGTAGPDSDVDLLVVMHVAGSARRERLRIRQALHAMGVPKDVVVVTPEEVERFRDVPGTLIFPAVREGQVLYERPC